MLVQFFAHVYSGSSFSILNVSRCCCFVLVQLFGPGDSAGSVGVVLASRCRPRIPEQSPCTLRASAERAISGAGTCSRARLAIDRSGIIGVAELQTFSDLFCTAAWQLLFRMDADIF